VSDNQSVAFTFRLPLLIPRHSLEPFVKCYENHILPFNRSSDSVIERSLFLLNIFAEIRSHQRITRVFRGYRIWKGEIHKLRQPFYAMMRAITQSTLKGLPQKQDVSHTVNLPTECVIRNRDAFRAGG